MAWIEQLGKDRWRVRYYTDEGPIGSIPGFRSKKAAEDHAARIEVEQRSGTWIDPAAGRTTVAEWVENDWLDALDVGQRTEDNYRSRLRNHILPRWGTTALADITGTKAQAWANKLRADGLARVTVTDIMKLLSLILADAADEKLITANPIRRRRRGRTHRDRTPEQVWATPQQVVQIADQAHACYGLDAAILIVTAAWTGARWGELTGLQRHNLHLTTTKPSIVVDPELGALHESDTGELTLGPPKTPESARTIRLPPFLVPLLESYLDSHDHHHVFVTPTLQLHRRSNFSRRALRPATDGNQDITTPRVRTHPIRPGLTFHGLRHSHKTWMIADGTPEIAQSRRLGHKLPDKIQETYSHIADEVETRLLTTLQNRWTTTHTPPAGHENTWRAITERPPITGVEWLLWPRGVL